MIKAERLSLAWLAPALVAISPIVIGSVYPNLIFSAPGGIDSYMFVGLGLHYDIPSVYATYYKVTRIPWILVEYWFRRLLPPLPAQYAIQYFIHMVLGLGFYFGLRRLLGVLPSFVGAVFLLAYTELYSAAPPDYMNTGSAALYVITFWLVTVEARRAFSLIRCVFLGGMFAFTVCTNVYFLLFVPMLLGHFVAIRYGLSQPLNLRATLSSAVAGGVAGTVLLGLVAVAYGRDFNFIWPEIRYLLEYSNPSTQTWYETWGSGWWYDKESYFGCFLATAIASAGVALVLIRSNAKDHLSMTARVSLLLQYVYAFAIFVALQTQGQAILQPNHVMFPLIIPFVMAIAALVPSVSLRNEFRTGPILLLGIWILIVGTLCWHHAFIAVRAPVEGVAPFVVGCAAIALLIAVVALGRSFPLREQGMYAIAAAAVLGMLNIQTASQFSVHSLFNPTSCTYRRDTYLTTIQLDRRVLSVRPTPQTIFVWVDENETMPLATCGNIRVSDIGWSFRSLGLASMLTPERETPENIRYLALYAKEPYILVASREPASAASILQKFAALGYHMRTEPMNIKEGALDLEFTTIRRPGN